MVHGDERADRQTQTKAVLSERERDGDAAERLCGRSLGLLDSRRKSVAALLLEEHNVETVKVRGSTTGLNGGTLLGPARGSPLLNGAGLVEELLDYGGAGCAGKAGHGQLRERQVLVRVRLARDTCRGSVNDGLR